MIPPEELKFEAERSPPPGGQHVGLGPVGVWATHIPTGTVAFCKKERSQHLNRQIAIEMLEWALASNGREK